MNYPIDPLEQLSNEELESLAAYEHPLSDSNIQNIQGRFVAKTAECAQVEEAAQAESAAIATAATVRTGRQAKPRRRLLMVAAIAAVFVLLVGFTSANRIYELYYQYFGEGANIAKYVSEIGQSASDQGFKMEVLSAVNDGENTYLFVEVTDETGDRLSDDATINRWSMTGSRPLGGGGSTLVGYDPATKTATFMIHSISAKPGDSVLFTLSSFMSGVVEYRIAANDINIPQLLAENEGDFVKRNTLEGTSGGFSTKFYEDGNDLDKVKEILELDAFALAIPGCDKAWISNIAYRDGKLHVQLGRDSDRGNAATWLALVNKRTGEELQSYYSIGAGQRNEDGLADHEEYVFEIAREALGEYCFLFEGFYYTQVIDGVWEVGFEVPERMDTIIKKVGATVNVSGTPVKLESVELSSLGITVRMQGAVKVGAELDIDVVYEDGSVYSITEEGMSVIFQDAGANTHTFTIVRPLPGLERVDHLIINGTRIDL
ncbi:MAG: DUF4179 domain-containing protein [Coriobacteriia bacterium]|nr:DUF4179 domain-containing protein [Coriobacteriia bacterium]